jgi:hypothetical protein
MTRTTYDLDLHGVVGIRLLEASPANLSTVARQTGLPATELDREPDVTIRFAKLPTDEPLTFVGLGETAYNRDGFFVLRGRGGSTGRTRVPFQDLGRTPELVCEPSVAAVPHLLSIINLVALSKGVLPMHASAFTVGPLGVLVTGWSKGGKTEALLTAVRRGGCYVGDEWVYLTADGDMLGLPEPIRVWDWQLRQLPELLRPRTRAERARLSTWRGVRRAASVASSSRLPGSGLARRALPLAARQTYLQVPPHELFGAERVAPRATLDAVVLMLSHDSPDIVSDLAGPAEVSGRMAASLAEERAPFMAHYRQFRFAFPDLSSPLVESAEAREAALLARLFDGRRCAKVSHPHPCNLSALGDAVLSAAREVSDRTTYRRVTAS